MRYEKKLVLSALKTQSGEREKQEKGLYLINNVNCKRLENLIENIRDIPKRYFVWDKGLNISPFFVCVIKI